MQTLVERHAWHQLAGDRPRKGRTQVKHTLCLLFWRQSSAQAPAFASLSASSSRCLAKQLVVPTYVLGVQGPAAAQSAAGYVDHVQVPVCTMQAHPEAAHQPKQSQQHILSNVPAVKPICQRASPAKQQQLSHTLPKAISVQ